MQTLKHATPKQDGLDALSDEQVASRVQSGCADAFAELDRRLRPRLLAALWSRLPDRTQREDVVQEVLLAIYRQIHRFDVERRLLPWALTIAFRLATDEQRRARSRQTLPLTGSEPTDASREPGDALADRELADNLWQLARQHLPDAQYTVLWLRLGEGLEPGEVAQVLGRSAVHVRVLHHRGVSRLRKLVDQAGAVTS